MIPQETVAEIFEKAIIEEVVGDFVALKKRGTNLIGLCPFHNEKTPSFNVSPSKGIYKCFGCGKGGNAVNFIMEHEHYTYPEALKQLAKKYNIEIEEREQTPEEVIAANERESLFIVNEFANKFFQENLFEKDEGRAIGYSYFKERGFTDETMKKFDLGYCPKGPEDSLTATSLRKGYKKEFLLQTGLTKEGQRGDFDFYRGRVMFPIRNLSGKCIGFGGRTLSTEKKIAKYFNSPESLIYHKSKVLYGLFEAKSAIIKSDLCYLVEGYTDVISMHQSGVENVVASSGTSLTADQIKLIRRYSPNITVIFDGDAAGIKASFRGIDMLLEEGMKVRVLALADGEDPDSLAKSLSSEALKAHLEEHSADFFEFKTDILLKDAGRDPIKKSAAIHEIIDSLALFPDKIERNLKSIELSQRLQIDQETLLHEIRKSQRKKAAEISKRAATEMARSNEPPPPDFPPPYETGDEQLQRDMPIGIDSLQSSSPSKEQEADLIRILLNYGEEPITLKVIEDELDEDGNEKESEETRTIEAYVMDEVVTNKIEFVVPAYKSMLAIYQSNFAIDRSTSAKQLLQHPDTSIAHEAASLISERHTLHDWIRHKIEVTGEDKKVNYMVDSALNRLKLKSVQSMIKANQSALKEHRNDAEKMDKILKRLRKLDKVKMELSEYFGNAII
jgi:DNA primase